MTILFLRLAVGLLLILLGLSVVKIRRLSKSRDTLILAARSALEDDGLLAQVETAEASGSALAALMLSAAREQRALPAIRTLKERPLLCGDDFDRYWNDFSSSDSPSERFAVVQHWHKKGFRFGGNLRKSLLGNASNKKERDLLRTMFDEQDAAENK